ncbi:DEAD/DEAH box helicase [Janibacter sp. Y6]|uniref:DEAD/DEAH box helicase n=1 Tax=Janibacter sp. Y6 TaxID=2913552 RepID=UPI0034A195EC
MSGSTEPRAQTGGPCPGRRGTAPGRAGAGAAREDGRLRALESRLPGRVRHAEHLPARAAQHAPMPGWVAPAVRGALAGAGVEQLWSHQEQVAQLAHAGHDVVVSTGTASGKSLGYLLPALTAAIEGPPSGRHSIRGGTTLYLAPTKALAADQLARVEAMAVPGVRAATYDGDTPTDERRWIREHAQIVLTNPDLVHHSMLPGHRGWAPFFRSLSYVVVDECHAYRGVFGTHVSLVLRRLLRVAERYGAHPSVVLASATVAEPARHAHALVGREVVAVTHDGSPRAGRTCVLWEPPEQADGSRRSLTAEAADVVAALVGDDVQTLAFARSRAGVESLAAQVSDRLELARPDLAGRVAAYRGGYLPEERRELEQRMRSRDLMAVAATNALELGVDITGLDAVVVAGWPGRRASWWQQAGRAGRDGGGAGRDALVVSVAADDPLDSWVLQHPEYVFGDPVEAIVMDPGNVHMLAPHVAAAAAEVPVTLEDERWFGPGLAGVLEVLTDRKVLRRRPAGWFWAREDRPGDHLSLRGAGPVVSVVEGRTGRVVGTVDAAAAHTSVHTGAVHVHQGQTYVVTDLDLDGSTATVVRGDPGWSTTAQSRSSFDIVREESSATFGRMRLCRGVVRVRRQVTSFVRRLPSGEIIGTHQLELPEQVLTTRGVWWTMTPDLLTEAGVDEADVPGAAHAAEHAAIATLPLLATCDRWDIGGVSTDVHPDTGLPTVLVYDGYPGGAGFAHRAHDMAPTWWRTTLELVRDCPCERGCPRCVQSPKCGNGNEPLDKDAAVALLGAILAERG